VLAANKNNKENKEQKNRKAQRVCWSSSVTNSPTLGAIKSGRKSTSVVLIQKLSANSSFTLYDLGPTHLDFNLGTPRSEISSHYPTVSHNPCDLSDQKQTNDEVTFKHKQLQPCLQALV